MKFTIRDLFLVTVIVALALALVYVKWPTGIGRYQMVGGEGRKLFVLDTATGKIWWQFVYQDKWEVYKTPEYDK